MIEEELENEIWPGRIQGSHQPVVIREDVGNARTETQVAKLSIDLSGELTADVCFFFSIL